LRHPLKLGKLEVWQLRQKVSAQLRQHTRLGGNGGEARFAKIVIIRSRGRAVRANGGGRISFRRNGRAGRNFR
jgi:hypothetical protein